MTGMIMRMHLFAWVGLLVNFAAAGDCDITVQVFEEQYIDAALAQATKALQAEGIQVEEYTSRDTPLLLTDHKCNFSHSEAVFAPSALEAVQFNRFTIHLAEWQFKQGEVPAQGGLRPTFLMFMPPADQQSNLTALFDQVATQWVDQTNFDLAPFSMFEAHGTFFLIAALSFSSISEAKQTRVLQVLEDTVDPVSVTVNNLHVLSSSYLSADYWEINPAEVARSALFGLSEFIPLSEVTEAAVEANRGEIEQLMYTLVRLALPSSGGGPYILAESEALEITLERETFTGEFLGMRVVVSDVPQRLLYGAVAAFKEVVSDPQLQVSMRELSAGLGNVRLSIPVGDPGVFPQAPRLPPTPKPENLDWIYVVLGVIGGAVVVMALIGCAYIAFCRDYSMGHFLLGNPPPQEGEVETVAV